MPVYKDRADVLPDMMEFFGVQGNDDHVTMGNLLREAFFILRVQQATAEINELSTPLQEPGLFVSEDEVEGYKQDIQAVMDKYMLTHDTKFAFGFVDFKTEIKTDSWPV